MVWSLEQILVEIEELRAAISAAIGESGSPAEMKESRTGTDEFDDDVGVWQVPFLNFVRETAEVLPGRP